MSLLEFLVCAALVWASGFLSSSEVALFSLSRFQLRYLRENFRPAHRKIKKLLSDPTGLLITVLVINEMLNIAISTVITKSLAGLWEPGTSWVKQTLAGTLVTTPILLFLCEMTPKVIGTRANQIVAPVTAGPLLIIYEAFKPIRIVLNRLVGLITMWFGPQKSQAHGDSGAPLREEEFLVMLEEGHKEGAIEQSELDLIRNVFDLDDTTVNEVVTPLPKVFTLPQNATLKSAIGSLKGHHNLRVPIIGAGKKVVGILYAKDLLRAKLDPALAALTVSELMHQPMVVLPGTRLNTLFRKFKQTKTHVAVVEGPQGESLGIVTMDDLLDVLFDDLVTP